MNRVRLMATKRLRLVARWTLVAGLFLCAPTSDASADCKDGAGSVRSVVAGSNLFLIMANATAPCTLNVGPGTYTAPGTNSFTIPAGITVRSTGGAAVTTLQVAVSAFSVVSIWPVSNSCPSGATLEGFTLKGGAWGVFVGADSGHPGCESNQVTNVTLRKLRIDTSSTADGHGINFNAVQSSVIDSCTIVNPYANGIILGASHNNIVMNNAILHTQTQHAIALQSSNDNVIVGNAISGSAWAGIILNSLTGVSGPGSSRNRIERNSISGHKVDGILVNDNSLFNFVGLNMVVSSSYIPGSSSPSFPSGTGIWVNNGSNGNYLFGNDLSGSPENGIDILTSRSTYLVANAVHGNYQGGVWVANVNFAAAPNAPPPQHTVLQNNRSFFNTFNGQLFLQGAFHSEAAYNYFSGQQGGALAGTSTVGVQVRDSVTANVFENTISAVSSRAFVTGSTENVSFFRNRFLRGTNVPNPPQTDGLNGTTFSILPADVRWDGGSVLGGNHWNEFTAAAANPDPNHPYTAFIGNTNGGPYVDRFPYQTETLQTINLPVGVTVAEPVAGSVLAALTTKTIRWVAQGCALVDIYYAAGTGAPVLVTSGYPNSGFFFWTVPAVAFRTDYRVQVFCTDSNHTYLGVVGNSAKFTIASSDLVLLNPGRGTRAGNNGVVRVAWKASAAVGGVDIFVKADGGSETQVASNVTDTTFADITLPSAVSNSSLVTVRIQDSTNGALQDSVDGYFMVRGATPSISTGLVNKPIQVGSIHLLQWNGVSSSYLVDVDLVGQTTTQLATNLPDFGRYTWLVPDAPSTRARIRVTLKDINGSVAAIVESSPFSVVRDLSTAPRNATPGDFDGDGKSDISVFRPSTGTWYIAGASSAVVWGGGGDIPIAGDYNGDGRTDIAVFRPSTGNWYIVGANSAVVWGGGGDIPVPGDYDGDGKSDIAVFRPSTGTWYIWQSQTLTPLAIVWGGGGDVPVAGDYDADGKSDIAVFRPATGTWYVWQSSTLTSMSLVAGGAGDIPVASDYDGDAKSDIGVFRPSTGAWHIYQSRTLRWASVTWGGGGDIPVPGDYDGDGKSDVAVFRPSTGAWFIIQSSTGTWFAATWGGNGDIPILKR